MDREFVEKRLERIQKDAYRVSNQMSNYHYNHGVANVRLGALTVQLLLDIKDEINGLRNDLPADMP